MQRRQPEDGNLCDERCGSGRALDGVAFGVRRFCAASTRVRTGELPHVRRLHAQQREREDEEEREPAKHAAS